MVQLVVSYLIASSGNILQFHFMHWKFRTTPQSLFSQDAFRNIALPPAHIINENIASQLKYLWISFIRSWVWF